MTETEQAPTTNGLPEENEDEEKTKLRPPDIDADMREMERRKRVEMIMSSRLFREELERIIESQMKEGGGPAGLLQQIQDMVGGASRLQANMFRGSNCVLPINDIRGVEAMGYAKGEKVLRCKLASVFRLMDLYGWSHGIHNLITGRLAQENEEFVVNPHGLMYHEVTASSLVKVDMQGNVVEQGTTNFGVNAVAFKLHAALHAARPDIKCVVHVRNPPVLAISSLKCGLLPISAESAVIGEVSSHQYLGSATEPEERDKIARSLGPVNKILLLTNHGALCCGETIEEAFFNVYNTVLACETQVKLMPLGLDNLVTLPDEARKALYDSARRAPPNDKKWRVGGLEFEALMRMLDNAGFRTGYIYRSPLVKNEPPKPRNDVEVPPAVSSLGYLLEEEEMYRQGNWKKGGVNRNDRSRWLNSPNVYQKVEILETGTTDPKKITKWVDANNAEEWVADGSPAHTSTPVKIDAALQFVPKNTNPKEFKKLQQQIKENRRADKITSGPQSHILEGVTWEEAKKLQDANISMTGDQVILVGAASKGIIQRGFQHNATVYKSPYAKNPFDCVSEQELEEYKTVVTRKQKGEYYADDTEQSESEALSSSAALIKSEQEDVVTEEPRVLRIETKTAPAPSQAEVVLSDDDFPDPHVERSKSQRYPTVKVPDVNNKRSSSADRAMKDVGVGQVVKCQLIDAEILTKRRLQYQTVGTQTKLEDEITNKEDYGLKISEQRTKAHSIPDILKIRHPPDRQEIMSKLVKELTLRFEKRVEEESITSLPLRKPITVTGSPTGFSSDGTTVSDDLSPDNVSININRSVTSLEEHIGEDFEGAFESDSSICGPPQIPAKLFYPDITASDFVKLYNTKSLSERCNSCESLLAEQDNLSFRTYVSSPDIPAFGFDEAKSSISNSTSIEDFEEFDEIVNSSAHFKQTETSECSRLKMSRTLSLNLNDNTVIEKDINKIVLSYHSYKSDGSQREENDETSGHETKTDHTSVSSLSASMFESCEDSSLTKTPSGKAAGGPGIGVSAFRYNGIGDLVNKNELLKKNNVELNSLDLNSNQLSYKLHNTFNSPYITNVSGYEGDAEKTLYESLHLSEINFDISPVSPSGYEADTDEMLTSFSHTPNALYTIYEEISPEV